MRQLILCLVSLACLGVKADIGYVYQSYPDAPPSYSYDWRVQDSYSGQDFGQGEVREGYATDGEYQVILPDGRKQIVTYKVADPISGYVADVKYEGEPQYAPAPAYKTPSPPYVAPVVTRAPVYKPYVAPKIVTPAPYKAPVQPYAYTPVKQYAPVQPYHATPLRRYNFKPVSAESSAPAEPAASIEPIAPIKIVAPDEAQAREDEGIEVENPVPVFNESELPATFDSFKSIFYEDARSLRPQRQEKVHNNLF